MSKTKKPKKTIAQEFADFINRGNVMDLAIGIIIGGAFGKIVSSLVSDIIMPIVSIFTGGTSFQQLALDIPTATGTQAHIPYGAFIQNIVDFLIVAFSVFIFIKLINRAGEITAKTTKTALKKVTASKTSAETIIKSNIKKSLD